jgi:hypothetical protein
MLQIVDINTNKNNIEEVSFIKEDFKKRLEPTVNNGNIIIISNFPSIGNMSGKIDYLILVTLKKIGGNYLRVIKNGKYQYIDNFILLVKKMNEENINSIDNKFIYAENSEFNYFEPLSIYNREFESYLLKFDKIKCFTIFHINTRSNICTSNQYLIINKKLSAELLLECVVSQFVEKYGDWRINSFTKEKFEYYYDDILIDFAKDLLRDTERLTAHGILTKKKIDRISTSIKIVDDIYQNVGKTISIISGKAGTGKTLLLSRIIHKHALNNHHIRFLTFNNLLVFDIKQNLKNFGYYGDNNISISTIHHFYYKLSQKLGISTILSADRVSELLEICENRIEKTRDIFERLKNLSGLPLSQNTILTEILKNQANSIDNDEFIEFSKYISFFKNEITFDEIKSRYLKRKRDLLEPNIGSKKFIENYYYILELIYLAVTNSRKFYDDLNIKNRYELLSILYNSDKFTDKKTITFENLENQIKSLKRTSNWSNLLIIDEGQDFHVLEKEILFTLRGSENIIIATGGKEQLIREPKVLNWEVSLGRKIPSKTFTLYGGSYRQKQNIISFVNNFSLEYGFNLSLKSIAESKGLGKIIIDARPKKTFLPEDVVLDFKANGEINGCSPYESMIILIPSRNYTTKKKSNSFNVNEKDYIKKTEVSSSRQIIDISELSKYQIFGWDGVSEEKGKLKIPNQIETRIIHYESCRGLESWTCACMSLDEYFSMKRSSDEAENHLSDDLHLKEEERRDKYAALWCIMAFTRPIDTLYIHLDNLESAFSKKIISIGERTEGVQIIVY